MTYSDFVAYFPEFTNVTKYPVTKVNSTIADAGQEINELCWGVYYNRGIMNLAGHMLSMWYSNTLGDGTNRADIVLTSGPDHKVEFAGNRMSYIKPSNLEKTEYGLEFLRLQKIVAYMQDRQTVAYG